ncbi:PucR family transcriptional regulator [Leucobacter iarius]|uniref:PucR C-terminal helix-turn-helix domain-containing protein n=1 Tax=Leucobacter iarius TaxID=333963 RepID=A0ABN2L8R6_9MICO
MTTAAGRTADASTRSVDDRVRHLIAATRAGDLAHLLGSARRALDAEIAFFDMDGNVLSSAPRRTLWDFEEVLAGRRRDRPSELTVHPVDLDAETVGLLAVRARRDPARLIPVVLDLLALEIGRLRAKQQGRSQLFAGLMGDLFEMRVSDADASVRLRPFGIDAESRQRVIVGWNPNASLDRQQLTSGSLYSLVHDLPDPLMPVRIGDWMVMVVPDDAMVDRLAETFRRRLAAGDAIEPVRVGVGLPHTGIAGLRASYHGALSAVQEGPGVRTPRRVDLAKLFVMTNTADSLRELVKTTLGAVIDYDAAHGSELLATLRALLEHNRSIQATTQALFVHRNTLRYRRGQIEELLGMNLDDSADIANLWLAFAVIDNEHAREGDA